MKLGVVVFSGYNERAVFAFLRVLRRHGIDSFIVANGAWDRVFDTSYTSRVVFRRPHPQLTRESVGTALDAVVAAAAGHGLMLAPSTEALNRFMLANPDLLASRGIVQPLVDERLYAQISDKGSFGELCRNNGIPVPDAVDDPERCVLPFVAKAVSYDIAKPFAPRLIMTEGDRRDLLRCPEIRTLYFQEYVAGRSVYLLLHIARNGEIAAFSQQNLVQQPQGKSIIAAVVSDFHLTGHAMAYVDLLKAAKFHGLIMIEVRMDDRACWMIEANPRFWGPAQLVVDAMRFGLFDAFLVDQGAEGMEPKNGVDGDRYFWYEGLQATLRAGDRPVYHDYDAGALARDFPAWVANDIYRRDDTLRVFARMLTGAWT